VAFVAELESDLKSHPNEWENITLETFLEALGAWAQGFRLGANVPASLDQPEAWALAAMLLWAGRIYDSDKIQYPISTAYTPDNHRFFATLYDACT
jgi:hypothetical protein